MKAGSGPKGQVAKGSGLTGGPISPGYGSHSLEVERVVEILLGVGSSSETDVGSVLVVVVSNSCHHGTVVVS